MNLLDVAWAEETCRREGPAALARAYRQPGLERASELNRVAEAVLLDFDFLSRYPHNFFQTVWNRCRWADCPLVEEWRAAKEQQGEFFWLEELLPPPHLPGSGLVGVFAGHEGEISSVAYSPDGRFLLSGAADTTLRLWNVEGCEQVLCLKGHHDGVMAVSFSSDGKKLLSGSWDGVVKYWNATSGELEQTVGPFMEAVFRMAFSPDARYLAVTSGDGAVRVFELATHKELWACTEFPGRRDFFRDLVFSRDGSYLLACRGFHVLAWETSNGRQVLVKESGHGEHITCLAWSPAGIFSYPARSINWPLSGCGRPVPGVNPGKPRGRARIS